MNPAAPYRSTCYFCGVADERTCHCFSDYSIKFSVCLEGERLDVIQPNFARAAKVFVNPANYYGEKFLEWEANKWFEVVLT